MRKGKYALLAAITVVAVAALTVATTAPARTGAQTAAIKAAWIYVGRTTTAAGRRPTTADASTSRRSSART